MAKGKKPYCRLITPSGIRRKSKTVKGRRELKRCGIRPKNKK